MRSRPIPGVRRPPNVLCSEPSPDWATALATALQLSGNGSVPSGHAASASGSYTTAETITQMAGRTAGVVALRDGLYAACQAYANGILGQDAYSLILSQYGNILVKLVSASNTTSPNNKTKPAGGGGSDTTTPSPMTALVNVIPSSSVTNPQSTKAARTTSAPPASDPMAEARAQAIDALLVACITETDPTRIRAAPNNILQERCGPMLAGIAEEVPALLKPKAAPSAQANNTLSSLRRIRR